MSRYRTLLSLGAFVLLVGLASLIATGAFGTSSFKSPPPPRATATVTPSPAPPSCPTDQLELVGVFNDCAVNAVNDSSYCSVSGGSLTGDLHLHGRTHDYLLYLGITGYHGPGGYGSVTVGLRESATGALWQSITGGAIRVTGVDGRSGVVIADLAYVGGEPSPPTVGLNVSGPWHCV